MGFEHLDEEIRKLREERGKRRIVVSIRGGVAEVEIRPKDVQVVIIDLAR